MSRLVLLAIFLIAAGCVEQRPETVQPAAPTTPDALPQPHVPWEIEDAGTVGWLAAVGTRQTFVGQFNEEYCPGFRFVIPEGTTRLILRPEAAAVTSSGAGGYEAELEGADGSTLAFLWPLQESGFEVHDPTPGPWALRVWPVGAAVQNAWDVLLVASGASEREEATLGLETMCHS